jgi:hypothetical protein
VQIFHDRHLVVLFGHGGSLPSEIRPDGLLLDHHGPVSPAAARSTLPPRGTPAIRTSITVTRPKFLCLNPNFPYLKRTRFAGNERLRRSRSIRAVSVGLSLATLAVIASGLAPSGIARSAHMELRAAPENSIFGIPCYSLLMIVIRAALVESYLAEGAGYRASRPRARNKKNGRRSRGARNGAIPRT